jgi:hypothetical protein
VSDEVIQGWPHQEEDPGSYEGQSCGRCSSLGGCTHCLRLDICNALLGVHVLEKMVEGRSAAQKAEAR